MNRIIDERKTSQRSKKVHQRREVEVLPRQPSPLKSPSDSPSKRVSVLNAPFTTDQKSKNFVKKFGHKKFFKIGDRAKTASIKLSAKIKEFKIQGKVFDSVDCESDLQRSMFFRLKLKSKSNQYDMVKELLEIYEEVHGKLPEEVIRKHREKRKREREEKKDGNMKRKVLEKKKTVDTEADEDNALLEAIAGPLSEHGKKMIEGMGEKEINDLLDGK